MICQRAYGSPSPFRSSISHPPCLRAAGITPANPLPGYDLSRHWQDRGTCPNSSRAIYAQSAPCHERKLAAGCETRPYKLIINMKLETRELYDLSADPAETKNLAEALPDVTTELATLLDDFERRHPDAEREPELQIDEATRERLRALGYTEQE